MGIAATVSRAPSDADDTLDLHWLSPRDGEDGEESVGEKDLRWVSTSRLPIVGDDALLFVDSLGDPWAFVWATGASFGADAVPEAVRLIGGVGQPAFQNSWANLDVSAGDRQAGFYRAGGRVHLTGVIGIGASGTTAFTLPVGYRPIPTPDNIAFPTIAGGNGIAIIQITPSGAVIVSNWTTGSAVTSFCFLDGVSFRHA
jgi:hypothetical protein